MIVKLNIIKKSEFDEARLILYPYAHNILHISQEVVRASPLSVPQFWSIALDSSFSQAICLY